MDEHYRFDKQHSDVYLLTFKQFITGQRNIELQIPYIIINEDISPKIYEYLTDLGSIEFRDGQHHRYYGEVKLIVNNFINYWSDIINECVKEADYLRSTSTRASLTELINSTIERQNIKHRNFLKAFLPAENEEEELCLKNLDDQLNNRIQDLKGMIKTVKNLDKMAIFEFAKHHAELSIVKKNQAFQLAHTNMANNMVKYTYRIRTSLEEILMRMNNNLNEMNAKKELELNNLMEELFDANKEHLLVTRSEQRRTSDIAEVDFTIQKIRKKIDDHQNSSPMVNLEEEVEHWAQKLTEFIHIEDKIKKVETELANVTEYLRRHAAAACIKDPPEPRHATCWTNIEHNYKQRKTLLEQILSHGSKSIFTFFAVRGQNRIFYKDKFGSYVVDGYGHKNHYFKHGKVVYHTTCDGQHIEGLYRVTLPLMDFNTILMFVAEMVQCKYLNPYIPRFYQAMNIKMVLKTINGRVTRSISRMDDIQVDEYDKYYFDEIGRYVLDSKGEKQHQLAPCTSTYNLNKDTMLLDKTTKDCGHSEIPNPECEMTGDTDRIVLLPFADPVCIKKSLQPEVVKYLWDAVGHILPEALADTGNKQSSNPIYYLANRLLAHKYHKNNVPQLIEKTKEADKYRFDVYKKRKDKAIAKALAFMDKQVKPRKPEESDNAEDLQFYAARQAIEQLTEQMAYDCYN